MPCRCDLMHHVRTQAPYALLVGVVSLITGDLMSGYVYPPWAGLMVTVAVVLALGYLLSAPTSGDRLDPVSGLWAKLGEALDKAASRHRSEGKAPPDASSHVVVKDPSAVIEKFDGAGDHRGGD